MKKALLIVLAVVTLLMVIACNRPVSAAELKSDKPRDTAPMTSPADLSTLVAGNSAFALNLYQQLIKTGGNIFYSPYSLSEALAMTYGGARGQTANEMAAAMQFLLSQDKLHPAFDSLDIALASRGQGAKGKDEKGFRLNVVNAIWGQKDFKFTSSYLDLLAQNYGAGLRILDFIKAPEPSRQAINSWVSDKTEGKIKDLLPQGSVTDMTRLVLTNAIYFNAAWASQFEKTSTHDGQFHLLTGSDVTVPMMFQEHNFKYAEGADYQAVELPYDGNQLSMLVILPAAGSFSSFEPSLTSQALGDIIGKLQSNPVNLTMPKFTIESSFGLKQTLTGLGMAQAFDPSRADFSGMDGAKDLYISDVVHKAYVTVDEAGTEAAAASGVIVGTTAMPVNIKNVTLDHPFIFLIRDIPTGAILFIGRVMNPAA
ncbi:MAG: serpin family protein [Dehalococcoidales bacterium]